MKTINIREIKVSEYDKENEMLYDMLDTYYEETNPKYYKSTTYLTKVGIEILYDIKRNKEKIADMYRHLEISVNEEWVYVPSTAAEAAAEIFKEGGIEVEELEDLAIMIAQGSLEKLLDRFLDKAIEKFYQKAIER